MKVTRRLTAVVAVLLLLFFRGLLVTSGQASAWIRALQLLLAGRKVPSTSKCCFPLPRQPHPSPRPSPVVGDRPKAASWNASQGFWPDCPVFTSPSSKVSGTTAGGCQLDDVHNLVHGHGPKGAVATELLKKCDVVPSNLVGAIRVFECKLCISDLEKLDFYVEPGGHYRPGHCTPHGNAAIIIPFRNRWGHLSEFLLNMHPLLQKQEMEYTIYVINLVEGSKFNRGMLFNVGVTEIAKIRNHTCYIFHDVDLLPENDKNLYRCPTGFHHYSVAVDKYNYRLPYDTIVGGVLAADRGAFEKVNGFSNLFFGWGGEDDDFSVRIYSGGFKLERFGSEVSRYKMIKHERDKGNELNPEKFALLKKTASRIRTDGLNSLAYTVVNVTYAKLFTLVTVEISQQDVMNKFSEVAAQALKRRAVEVLGTLVGRLMNECVGTRYWPPSPYVCHTHVFWAKRCDCHNIR